MTNADAYREALAYLATTEPAERERRRHRLPVWCYSLSDCEFLFTLCARAHGQPFACAPLADEIVRCLLWRARHHRWTLYCYCLMPDHLHFVASLPDEPPRLVNAGVRGVVPEGMLDHVARFKRYTTTQVWWSRGGSGALWQKSSFDRVVRYNESLDAAVE